MPKNSPREFTVIKGGGGGIGKSETKSKLQIVLPKPKRVPIQLQMPFKGTLKPLVISAGFDDLSFSRFIQIISECQIRYVIDIRFSPLFRGKGFSREVVEHEFSIRRISYMHMPEFNNPFANENMDPNSSLAYYSKYLEGQIDGLRKLQQFLSESPIFILGWSSERDRSNRDTLLNSLAELNVDFDLILP